MTLNNSQADAQALIGLLSASKRAAMAGEFDLLPAIDRSIEELFLALEIGTSLVDRATLEKIKSMADSNSKIVHALLKGINTATSDIHAIHTNAKKLAIYTETGKIEETQIVSSNNVRRI